MKEKIWMEKLIELLNEYSKNIWYFNEEDLQWQTKAWILSKEFWWIKWLVENDKININEEWNDYEKANLYCNSDFFQLQKHYSYYESLLMLLSISDSPIEDLLLYLK